MARSMLASRGNSRRTVGSPPVQAQAPHAQADEDARERRDLLEREHVLARDVRGAVVGDAVGAPVVAAIRHRDAQVVDHAPLGIDERSGDAGSGAVAMAMAFDLVTVLRRPRRARSCPTACASSGTMSRSMASPRPPASQAAGTRARRRLRRDDARVGPREHGRRPDLGERQRAEELAEAVEPPLEERAQGLRRAIARREARAARHEHGVDAADATSAATRARSASGSSRRSASSTTEKPAPRARRRSTAPPSLSSVVRLSEPSAGRRERRPARARAPCVQRRTSTFRGSMARASR
jgi:hypothetical protein